MEYIRVHWIHNSQGDPVLLYSELDDSRYEVRKIEVFSDQTIGFAEQNASQGSTVLGKTPIPPIEEIAWDKQFKPEKISESQFELIWRNRFNKNLPQ